MKRGKIGILLLALAVAAGLGYGFLPRAVEVEAVAASRGRLAVTVDEEGKTRVRERYVVSAPVSGYARRIELKVGDAVAEGALLTRLDPSRSDALDPRSRAQASARVRAAEAALAAAGQEVRAAAAAADLSAQNLVRSEALSRDRFVSEAAVDQARSEQERGRAVLQAAEHAVSVARYDRDAARAALLQGNALLKGGPVDAVNVRAPVAGRVLKVLHESEGAVQAGQPLIEVGNPDSLEVEVEVLSTAAVKIHPGTRVSLDRWGGEHTLAGRVRVVEPAGFTKVSALGVEEQRVRVIIDITSPAEQWRRLGDGYRVEAAFIVWEGGDVLLVPTSALFRHAGGWAVFVIEDGNARRRSLQIGQRNGLRAQVLSGLKEGERVVTHPDDKIADGVEVKPRGAAP